MPTLTIIGILAVTLENISFYRESFLNNSSSNNNNSINYVVHVKQQEKREWIFCVIYECSRDIILKAIEH